MKKLFLLGILFLFVSSLFALNFVVDGIGYNITSSTEPYTVAVTSNSSKYEGDIVIPDQVQYNSKMYSVESISSYAFHDCSGLISVVIPNSVTAIGYEAFYGCSGLTSVNIPNSVTEIEEYSFYGCSSLSSLILPNSLTSISGSVFVDCKSLTSIEISADNLFYTSSDGVLYNKNKTELIKFPQNIKGDFVIPNSVTAIGHEAFYGCTGLTSVTIPNSVTAIGHEAFYGCTGLTSVTIPNSVAIIGFKAFLGCTGLTAVVIPNSVTTIKSWAFSSCTGLTSIAIPNSITTIEGYAFSNCTGLISVVIPNSITTIEGYAFFYCTGLTSVDIPNSVTEIGREAFKGCTNLTSVTISNSVTKIGSYVFYGCTGLTSVTIPNSVAEIEYKAFSGCTGLTSVVIPNSVTTIGNEAFSGCTRLTSIDIPNSVTIIEDNAFSGCTGLTSVVIPNSVTIIEDNVFSGCTGLTSVVIPNSVTTIRGEAFSGCTRLTSIDIPNSVTTIGGEAFSGCTGLTSIVIPNSVTAIGYEAFYGCTGLTSVVIPNSVTIIGSEAFCGCTSLTSVTIPNSITVIGKKAFFYCTGLTSVVIPNSVKEIKKTAFWFCSDLKSIVIPNSVTSILEGAFMDCIGVTSIVCHSAIPPTLGSDVFYRIPKNIPLYVPYTSVYLYQQADQWKDFNIRAMIPIVGSGKYLVSGKLYMDANANGKNDNDERGLPQQKILILPDSVYALTDNAGSYTFRCDTGSYQIQLVLPDNWRATTAAQYDIAVRNADTSGFDFGIVATREESRSEVSIASLDGGRCFEPAPVYLTYNNMGTSVDSGWLKYYPDSQFGAILKSVPAYDSLSADSSIVYWKMSDVMPFEQRMVMLQMQMPDFRAMGDTLVSALAFEDKASVQYTDTAKLIVRCSYDPNDKQVNPAGVQDEHFVLMSDPLEFTIRFQNTGNDVANRVVILDTLSQHLDLATFQVIASSHSVKTNRNNVGAVEFRFDDIKLPDSTTNEPASHGFVKYRVKAKTGLPDSTVVNNTSYIFFDYNPAVVTNTTAITMTYKIPVKEVPTTEDPTTNVSHSSKYAKAVASIHPNPFSKTALLEFDNPNKDVFELQIADIAGKTHQSIKSTGELIVIERGAMTEGLYFFTLRNTATGQSRNGSFVVE